ncbi:extracellular solute-binding protein [Paenibacillus sp.]|uniref:extracellular solute-binding protein n=1 Tax=Paenibacillus sp. TaxID=58172 RepID=UPI002D36128D|nr:extracellular solute-binding protein [Paenibacillus sp.]HZG55030.1 extracellular solute-binding protein [Paenibacillus sp.]
MITGLKKGRVSLLLSLCFALLVTACSGGGAATEPTPTPAPAESKQGEASADATDAVEPVAFSYLAHTRIIGWIKDSNWLEETMKRTNTTIEYVDGGEDPSYTSNVDLRVGGSNFPDAGIVTPAQALLYGQEGAFLDLKPLIDQYAPNIKKYIESDATYRKLVTNENGQIYGLTFMNLAAPMTILYRKDMFDKVGVTSEPRTIDELTNAFRKLKAEYGATNNTFYPYTGRGEFTRFFLDAFNASAKVDADGKVHGVLGAFDAFDLYAPGYKSWVEWHNLLYKEGLIDPEFATNTQSEETWQTKMLTGSGAFNYDHYSRPEWFMINGGPENDPNYQTAVMTPFLDLKGEQSKQTMSLKYLQAYNFVINAKAKDKAPGILRYLDYMWSDEGQTLSQWGIEGETFAVANGKKQHTVNYKDEVTKVAGQKRWEFGVGFPTFPRAYNVDDAWQWSTEQTREFATRLFNENYTKPIPFVKYTTEQSAAKQELAARVLEEVKSNVIKFVRGDRPMSEWDAFLADMEKLGYKKITEIDQAAYDATSAK